MQTTLLAEHGGDEGLQINCNINVVIAFEDAAAGKHADAFYEHLSRKLSGDFEFTRYQWSFALLEDEAVRDVAAHDATMADIVIIATHGDTELPEHVDAWFQAWVGRNAGPMALVALFDRPADCHETREDVRSALARLAQMGGMDFFAEPENSPNTEFVNRLVGKI
ncbi:MAG TPA: hypothetical protein VJ063_18325 [Verrucomicrobiae bacterium]|nr:hypothetical protein [Verrucomicrobiae bacterium]